MPVESFGYRNIFRPSNGIIDPRGWSATPDPLGIGASPASNRLLVDNPSDVFATGPEVMSGLANPPFTTGAAGRINTMIHDGSAGKILRGFIRRANVVPNDRLSKSRLYFMYNPPSITRQYIAYLDQAALDPFNTIYGSGNLVAPPGFLDFTFELFFDRQDEASRSSVNRGVYVDYEMFDQVVRNVPPAASDTGTGSSLQDNGVMLINPRDITVVFSSDLTIQGRAYNAQVSFDKFTNRMIPIRMRIGITMKVLYIGPERPQTEQVDFNQESNYRITVPYSSRLGLPETSADIQAFRDQLDNSIRAGIEQLTAAAAGGGAYDLSGAVLTERQILFVVQTIGVPETWWVTAIAVCLAESGGKVANVSPPNTNGTYDRGLWQINDVHSSYDKEQLVSFPMYNARAMYNISGGGVNWTPWSAYNNGAYQQYIARALAAVAAGPEILYNGNSPVQMLAAQEAANGPANTDAIARLFSFAHQFVGLPYVAGGTSLINGCDCTGFIFALYREHGLLTAMHWESGLVGGNTGTEAMMNIWRNHGWDSGLALLNWTVDNQPETVKQQLFNTLRPGDFLIRTKHPYKSEHIAMFSHWNGDSPVVFHQSQPPGYVNEDNTATTYGPNWVADAFNWAVRPRPLGSLNSSRAGTG